MPERRVAEVVCQRDRLDEVFVQADAARDRAGQLGNLERVREARAEQVAFVIEEHLGLVDQASKRRAVDDAVAVPLELVAARVDALGMPATAARLRVGCGGIRHVHPHARFNPRGE